MADEVLGDFYYQHNMSYTDSYNMDATMDTYFDRTVTHAGGDTSQLGKACSFLQELIAQDLWCDKIAHTQLRSHILVSFHLYVCGTHKISLCSYNTGCVLCWIDDEAHLRTQPSLVLTVCTYSPTFKRGIQLMAVEYSSPTYLHTPEVHLSCDYTTNAL